MNDFTYNAYSRMIELLKRNGYKICLYDEVAEGKQCILRHDIDFDIKQSLELAQLEHKLGVKSTYFVLLKTDFYNPLSKKSIEMLKRIIELDHEIGLHFDEKSYEDDCDVISAIKKECLILEQALDHTIKVVSMHRPSKKTLESNYVIGGVINSYSEKFFKEYKYISDSRRNWREDAFAIIESNQFCKLHILTHAFWYHEHKSDLRTDLKSFIEIASLERKESLGENLTNFESAINAGK